MLVNQNVGGGWMVGSRTWFNKLAAPKCKKFFRQISNSLNERQNNKYLKLSPFS